MKEIIREMELEREMKRSLRNEEIASSRITRGLKALEIGCYAVAKQAAELCLSEAEFIDQRMAACSIRLIAELQDEKLTKDFLATVYGI